MPDRGRGRRSRRSTSSFPGSSRVGYVRGAADRVPEALAGRRACPSRPPDRRRARTRRPLALRRDPRRQPRLRDRPGPRARERPPARLRPRGRTRSSCSTSSTRSSRAASRPTRSRSRARTTASRTRPRRSPSSIPQSPRVHDAQRIGPEDWDGWVQERGLYFARSWAPEYTPLLAMADPGGPEQKGALLVARARQGALRLHRPGVLPPASGRRARARIVCSRTCSPGSDSIEEERLDEDDRIVARRRSCCSRPRAASAQFEGEADFKITIELRQGPAR